MSEYLFSPNLDLAQFEHAPLRDFNRFFVDHGDELTAAILKRSEGTLVLKKVGRIPNMVTMEAVTNSASKMGVSVHFLLVGSDSSIELLPSNKAFLQRMEKLSTTARDHILYYLERNQMQLHNPYFLYRNRLVEYAQCNGMTVTDILKYAKTSFLAYRNLLDLCCGDEIPLNIRDCDDLPIMDTTSHHLVLCRTSAVTQVPADYFVVQDYSKYATIDGTELTDTQRDWLSTYLLASDSAKEYARFFLVTH